MPEVAAKCKGKSSIFNDMREILALDLTRNELKVLIAYRLEMDEDTRQVRGKSQEELRALTGLGRSQFSEASGSLQRRGLIDAKRARNAPQKITVPVGMSGNQEVRETQTSGSPVIRDSGRPEIPDLGQPENPDDDIYTAPITTPKSAPQLRALPAVSDLKALSDRLFKIAEPCLSNQAIAPGLASMMIPQMWLDHGADLERDIIPVLLSVVAKGKRDVATWDYFTKPVAEAKARRLKGLPDVDVSASPLARKRLDISKLKIVPSEPEAMAS